MTINLSDNDPRISYTVASGATQGTFTVPFEFFTDADLNLYVDGTLKTLSTDYTTTGGDGSTGSIVMNAGSEITGGASGSTVVITRSINLERTTDFQTSGPFAIAALNTELDKLVAIQADLKDSQDRSLQLTDYDSDASLTLPDVNTRKGKLLAFNATTGAVEAGASISGTTTVAGIAADIETLADIEDGTDATDAIQTVAGISGNVTTVAGISGNVSTVSGISADVTAVAGDEADIGTVAGSIADVNTVAGIDSDVTTVAGISANVTTVAGDSTDIQALAAKTTEIGLLGTVDAIADMNTLATSAIVTDMDALADLNAEIDALGDVTADITTVAGIESDVTTVAGVSGNVTTVAGVAPDVTTVAGISANTTTVAGISANVTTVAGISGDVTTVAGDAADISTVAGISADVSTVASNDANVTTVAANISGVNSFGERYRVGATDPTTSLDEGDLFFNTTSNEYKFYDGSAWQAVNVTGLGNLVEDTSPQLGGDLDVQTNSIVSTSNQDINITPNGTGSVVLDGLSYPQADGTTGQFLKTDGAGQLAFDTVSTDLVADTTPQLGGDLDVNGNSIVSVSNGDIDIAPDGTGSIVLDGLNWPTSDGSAGQLLKTDGAGQLSFGAGGMDWSSSPQTASFTAAAGKGYFVDTSSSAITVTLPASPSGGDRVAISDYKGNAATNNITVEPNGSKIEGNPSTFDLVLATDSLGAVFIYSDSAQGWIRFIADVASEAQLISPTYDADVLVVAGGGGGGSGHNGGGGGGGAGGYIANSSKTLTRNSVYTVTVGAGGAGSTGTGTSGYGTAGGNSSLTGETTSVGGGRGGYNSTFLSSSGGSGGGGGGNAGTAGSAGTSGQGNAGGNAAGSGASASGGGGGGSGGAGATGVGSAHGGAGTANSITGSSVTYAGGGGGGAFSSSGGTGNGGGANGGGGFAVGGDATDGTGGGGGGGGQDRLGGDGGNGVVIISVPTLNYTGTTTGSPTVTTSGSNTIMKFTASGSYTA